MKQERAFIEKIAKLRTARETDPHPEVAIQEYNSLVYEARRLVRDMPEADEDDEE